MLLFLLLFLPPVFSSSFVLLVQKKRLETCSVATIIMRAVMSVSTSSHSFIIIIYLAWLASTNATACCSQRVSIFTSVLKCLLSFVSFLLSLNLYVFFPSVIVLEFLRIFDGNKERLVAQTLIRFSHHQCVYWISVATAITS